MRWWPTSLRLRLVLGIGICTTALLGGAGYAVTHAVEGQVVADFDRGLLRQARQLAALCEDEDGTVELDYVPRFHAEYERDDDPDCFEFFLDDGSVLHGSRHLPADEDLVDELVLDVAPRFADRELDSGRRLRVVQFAFWPKAKGDGPATMDEPAAANRAGRRQLLIAVGRGRAALDTLLADLCGTTIAVIGSITGATLLLVWLLVRRGLRPVGEVARQVAALAPDELERRVELPLTPRELAPIVDQINAFAERLHQAMARERRFSGNVAHELRTPVAELRSLAAVATRWPDDVDGVLGFFGDVRDIAGRMEAVIKSLLLLARCHSGREPLTTAIVGVAALLRDAVARHRRRAAAAGLELDVDCDGNPLASVDADKFGILLDNLIGNALGHASPAMAIHCRVTVAAGRWQLDVANRAEPMSAAELSQLTEPFWRRDQMRAESDHVGLGLTIVQTLADLLEVEVSFRQDDDGIFHASVAGTAIGAATTGTRPGPRRRPRRSHDPIRGEAS
ncbi:MAG: sensor histidine kinase N-terminal domain-containing protein [Planctomycetes bacterium]|nr:sensor histidine kinase N-terminal domain-containing protein [Planctomycetota bacterium]